MKILTISKEQISAAVQNEFAACLIAEKRYSDTGTYLRNTKEYKAMEKAKAALASAKIIFALNKFVEETPLECEHMAITEFKQASYFGGRLLKILQINCKKRWAGEPISFQIHADFSSDSAAFFNIGYYKPGYGNRIDAAHQLQKAIDIFDELAAYIKSERARLAQVKSISAIADTLFADYTPRDYWADPDRPPTFTLEAGSSMDSNSMKIEARTKHDGSALDIDARVFLNGLSPVCAALFMSKAEELFKQFCAIEISKVRS
jgi:hypothetical protein